MKVITVDAYTLGEIDGAHVDTKTWQLTYFEVSLTREATIELGLQKPMLGSVTFSLPINAVAQIGDVITLNKSLVEFKNLKEYTAE